MLEKYMDAPTAACVVVSKLYDTHKENKGVARGYQILRINVWGKAKKANIEREHFAHREPYLLDEQNIRDETRSS